jgi:hypothetical protein
MLALAAVAFDPLSIAYGKILKQYSAEAFLCLLAIDRAAAFGASRSRRDLVLLTGVLTLGLCLANSQLFVMPPVLAALILDAAWRRDARSLRALFLASVVIGVWDVVYYGVVMAPRLPVVADRYWARQLYLPATLHAAEVAWGRLSWTLTPSLGVSGVVAGTLCLALGCIGSRQRIAALAVVLLVLELMGFSMARLLPFNQPRIFLFLTSAITAYAAAALAAVVVRARSRPALGVMAACGLAVVAWGFVRVHPWPRLGQSLHVEDAGPLVRTIERGRTADDLVLLHQKSLYIFAYYQRAIPVLAPLPTVAIRYVPRLEDDRIVLVNDTNLVAKLTQALQTEARVWLLLGRLRPAAEQNVRKQLAPFGAFAHEERRRGALLLRLDGGGGGC